MNALVDASIELIQCIESKLQDLHFTHPTITSAQAERVWLCEEVRKARLKAGVSEDDQGPMRRLYDRLVAGCPIDGLMQ